jgi:hypothetical protein
MARRDGATARKLDRDEGMEPKREPRRMARQLEEFCFDALTKIPAAKVMDVVMQWAAKADIDPDDPESAARAVEATALAGLLTLFSPTLLGPSPLERYIRQRRADASAEERGALEALAKTEFHLLRFESLAAPRTFVLQDLANGERLLLHDEDIPQSVMQLDVGAWLAPLSGDEFIALGPLTPLDAQALAEGLSFVRPGKGLSNPRRCAAAVYRHVARHGAPRIEGLNALLDDAADEVLGMPEESEWDDLDRLAAAFTEQRRSQTSGEENIRIARSMAGAVHLAHALSRSAISRRVGHAAFAESFAEIGFIMMETLDRRAAASHGGQDQTLAAMAEEIERAITQDGALESIRPLFESLRLRLIASRRAPSGAAAEDDGLARVLQRIQALRAKTLSQGCTEQEVLAAAEKVAELLDRYGLSLSEIEMRERPCEGVGVDTGRKRRAPIDDCPPAIGAFCDCKVWFETTAAGSFRVVFFGLPADVAAAHYLYELVVLAFKTETADFQARQKSSKLRESTRSFQIGLAHGICLKLRERKAEREATMQSSSGRALAPIKASVIEEEMEKLGLSFRTKSQSRRRNIEPDAYRAGVAAGKSFEPHRGVASPKAEEAE